MTGFNVGWECVKCGVQWGSLVNVSSHGLCIKCLAEWIINRRHAKGMNACFGKNGEDESDNCNECSIEKYCKEYMETL